MRILDLFAGLKGWSEPWEARGHEVVSIDIEERFAPTIVADVLTLPDDFGRFDVVLASPPCEKFSLLTIGKAWLPGYVPRHSGTVLAMELVRKTVRIIEAMKPSFWIIENPVGMLRKLNLIPYERQTVTLCSYGSVWRKPTDLWGGFPPSLELRAMCRNGDPCHIAAPRGSRTGVQGPDSAAERAKMPERLALTIMTECERSFAAGLRAADYTGSLFG